MKGLNERQLAQADRLYVDAIRNMRDVLNESLGRLAHLESALGMKKCALCGRWVATKLETGGKEVPRRFRTVTEALVYGDYPAKDYLCPTCVAAVGGGGLSPEAKPTFAGLTLEGTVVARATDPPRCKKGKGGKA